MSIETKPNNMNGKIETYICFIVLLMTWALKCVYSILYEHFDVLVSEFPYDFIKFCIGT